MRLKDQLLHVADSLAALQGIPESRVSRLLFGKGNGLSRLRRGADMQSRNVEDALARLSFLWPADAEWPSQVSRPAPLDPRPIPAPATESV